MTYYRKLIETLRNRLGKKGVALFMVLAAMATLAIFVGEITYVSQINQKLAYDRLDNIKATALAKSGFRLALLRIRAYSELKKTVGDLAKKTGASAADVGNVVPKGMIEKIWAEPITIPFSGDISGLPGTIKDALLKFRKDSGMEGKLYISISPQSGKINLNSAIEQVAALAPPTTGTSTSSSTGTGTSTGTDTSTNTNPGGTNTTSGFNVDQSRQAMTDQIKATFAKKSEDDETFRDAYRSYRIEDLMDDIFAWSDLTYTSTRSQNSTIPYKQAPFYDVSELHFLSTMDDTVYDLLASQFTAGVTSNINVNKIQDAVLAALIPQMTKEERKKFYDFLSGVSEDNPTQGSGGPAPETDNSFKTADDFYKYIGEKVAYFSSNTQKMTDFKASLVQRGINLITEESDFIVRIEATVQQTKRVLEAKVSLLPTSGDPGKTGGLLPGQTPAPTPAPVSGGTIDTNPIERSNLKVTQLRFL